MNRQEQRNGVDRRRRKRPFVLLERRSGFDRRSYGSGVLAQLRERPLAVAGLLISVNALNTLDLVFTQHVLSHGAREINPIMAALLSHDPVLAGVFKIGMIAVVSVLLWVFRRYKSALQVTMGAAAVFACVVAYQTMLQAALRL